jgi:hypothetical protein
MDTRTYFDPTGASLWPLLWTPSLMQLQRAQLDLLLGWQRQLATMQQDLFDQWAAHWAGGVPIDA